MRKTLSLSIVFAVCIIFAFLAGAWMTHRSAAIGEFEESRTLHYICPMHPQYVSDRNGDCPSCGMRLVPVYEDGMTSGGTGTVPGAITISPEKRQEIGVVTGRAESAPWSGTIRILGTVEPDEARTYVITSTSDIWIRKTFKATTGSIVRKDEPLAAFFTNGYLAAANSYLYALDTQKRNADTENLSVAQKQNLDFQMRQATANLINMGVSESQIQEMGATGNVSQLVEIRSPSKGFVLSRDVSEGQFIRGGQELYRIADIDKIWILADLFEYEYRFARAGQKVQVHYQGRTYPAIVSDVLPQFDPVSRTFKVRLVADNPEYVFRPDMFVDVDLPVNLPESLNVPAGAVVDTGTRKTVYVESEDGIFEPRLVETGWRFGNRIEITDGLEEGERIVLAGNFLIDSESRIKLAAAGLPEDYVLDPVCGMGVDPRKAKYSQIYEEKTYYFCSRDCEKMFEADPEKYLQKRPGAALATLREETDSSKSKSPESKAKDPVCGMDVDTTNPEGLKTEYEGKTYYFCGPMCKESFLKNPAKYLSN